MSKTTRERVVAFRMDGQTVTQTIVGETAFGEDVVMLEGDDNLLAGLYWEQRGYAVETFLEDESEYQRLLSGVTALVRGCVEALGLRGLDDFALDQYHHLVPPEIHGEFVKNLAKGFPIAQFPIDKSIVEARVSEVLGGLPVTCGVPDWNYEEIFCLRIIRPRSTDNNPPHRDVWLDHLRHAVNIYVPLAGSNQLSALPVAPETHFWRESDIERTATGATINDYTYRVPSVVGARRPLAFVRPNPGPNEFMLFSPYMIHGGGTNLNPDTTRVSLEMRFWRRPG